MIADEPFLLPSGSPHLAEEVRHQLTVDYHRFRDALPADPNSYVRETYGVDISGEYAGHRIRNPFGKASGQLSLNVRQVRRDAEGGLGFVVLKTVIAEDAQGIRKMADWAVRETRMQVEQLPPENAGGVPGWTVTWKGRGWHESFEDYCHFFSEALAAVPDQEMVVAPSVKYHLPPSGESQFAEAEYGHTTQRLLEVWRALRGGPMPLEKDFSPTLAGDDRSREDAQVLHWLRNVPSLIYNAAAAGAVDAERGGLAMPEGAAPVTLGMKLMNARSDLDFQVEMVRVLTDETRRPPEYLVYANRLFDPEKVYEGKAGVAFGGPELSRRNLSALRRVLAAVSKGTIRRPVPAISGTGDILNGRMAVEYGLLGASSCQMHTLFQLPDREFGASMRNKSAAVLHHLLLHPENGCVAWLLHLAQERGRPVSWLDLPALGRGLVRDHSGATNVWGS